jgi:hypothetical protein
MSKSSAQMFETCGTQLLMCRSKDVMYHDNVTKKKKQEIYFISFTVFSFSNMPVVRGKQTILSKTFKLVFYSTENQYTTIFKNVR